METNNIERAGVVRLTITGCDISNISSEQGIMYIQDKCVMCIHCLIV